MKYERTEAAISLHGLGFIQVQMGGNQRFHVWHPELPRRADWRQSSIHDHRFSFESRVLIGTQINTIYELNPDDDELTHQTYLHEGARMDHGGRPWIPDFKASARRTSVQTILAGRDYLMPAYAYHTTTPGGDGRVATVIRKTWEGKRGAHSVAEIGTQVDVAFDRFQWSETQLWDVVVDVMGHALP